MIISKEKMNTKAIINHMIQNAVKVGLVLTPKARLRNKGVMVNHSVRSKT